MHTSLFANPKRAKEAMTKGQLQNVVRDFLEEACEYVRRIPITC